MQMREHVGLWVWQKLIAMCRVGLAGYNGGIWLKASPPELYSSLSQW